MKIDTTNMKDWPMKLGDLPRKGDKFNVQILFAEDKEMWVDSNTALSHLYDHYLSCFCDSGVEARLGLPIWEETEDYQDWLNSKED